MIERGTWRALALVAALALSAAGCSLDAGAAGRGSLMPPVLDRAAVENQLRALQAAQSAALDLWDRLIAGEDVLCVEAIPLPPPLDGRAATPQAGQLVAQLGAARSALEQSAARWDMECGYDGATVGLDAARVGRDAARQATAPLQAAQALLAAWP